MSKLPDTATVHVLMNQRKALIWTKDFDPKIHKLWDDEAHEEADPLQLILDSKQAGGQTEVPKGGEAPETAANEAATPSVAMDRAVLGKMTLEDLQALPEAQGISEDVRANKRALVKALLDTATT